MVEMECLLLLWTEDCNKKQIPISLASIKAKGLRLVATVKENGNYKETEKEHFTANKGWFHRFQSLYEFIDVLLSGEAASSDKDATVKFAPFQESQAVLALQSTRLLCKNFLGFGYNVNGVLEDADERGNVDTAAILDTHPEQFSEGEHSYKGGKAVVCCKG